MNQSNVSNKEPMRFCKFYAFFLKKKVIKLLKNHPLHPWEIKLTQELKLLDHQNRRLFVNWDEQQLENYPDFNRKIILNVEAHFWLNDFVNKQNMRYLLYDF